jgi:hypothetical protein
MHRGTFLRIMLSVTTLGIATLGAIGAEPAAAGSSAGVPCSFANSGSTMRLNASCTAATSIVVPAGKTLDGRGFTIVAVGAGFVDGVIVSHGPKGSVKNLTVHAEGASSATCATDVFAAIALLDSSGTVENNRVYGAGCYFGVGILAQSTPFDGSHPHTRSVTIKRNNVDAFGDVGVEVRGDVKASVERNEIHLNTSPGLLPEFGVAFFHGASGEVERNHIFGGQSGDTDLGLTGILIAESARVKVARNDVSGAVIGIGVGTECRFGVTAVDVRVEANTIASPVVGVYVTAFVGPGTICDPVVKNTSIKDNKIVGDAGITGILIDVAAPEGGFTPVVTSTAIRRNDVAGFATCIDDLAGTATSQRDNRCAIPAGAAATTRRVLPSLASSRLW